MKIVNQKTLTIFFLILILFIPICTVGTEGAVYSIHQAVLSLAGNLQDNGYYTSDVEASLYTSGEVSDDFTVEYSLYNQEWITYEQPFTIYEEGQTVVYYRVRNDREDFIGETKFSMVDIDKTPPKGSITIDNGLKETFDLNVTLTLTAIDEPSGPTTLPPSGYIWGVPSGPSDMRFSSNGIVWSTWEPISKEKTWLLDAGAGMKTVYAQVRDNAGLISETFSDNITLKATQDTKPPITKITISGKQDSLGVYISAVTVSFFAVDDISGVSLIEYSFDNLDWQTYSTPIPIYNQNQTNIYFRSHDAAGNVESPLMQTIVINEKQEGDNFSFTIISIFAAALIAIILTLTFYFKFYKNTKS